MDYQNFSHHLKRKWKQQPHLQKKTNNKNPKRDSIRPLCEFHGDLSTLLAVTP